MRAVLFDLDGTLLDLDLHGFLDRYFTALSAAISELVDGKNLPAAIQAVHDATATMMNPHPGETNRAVFNRVYLAQTGLDLDEHSQTFDVFYDSVFPGLRGAARPAMGVREALTAVRQCGLRIAIATNPIFPQRAVEHRLAWAGVSRDDYDVLTSYEWMTACKPQAAYFRETATMLGVEPSQCMMVGDDPVMDMSAGDVGMSTFFVGDTAPGGATYCGTLLDLADLLTRTCA